MLKNKKIQNNLFEYLSGDRLWGDDFTKNDIELWFKEECEGYANLLLESRDKYKYTYYALDKYFCYKYIPNDLNDINILGIGSAYGHELIPFLDKAKGIDILEPSDLFLKNKLFNTPVKYTKPKSNGIFPFENDKFDLIICFSSLHHIANVTTILYEIKRVLKIGGYVLIREPISSMREPIYSFSDFHKARKGLSPRERGIPIKYFRNILTKLDFIILKEFVWGMPITRHICRTLHITPYNSRFITMIDIILSKIFSFNICYHTYSLFRKLRPQCVIYILKKQ